MCDIEAFAHAAVLEHAAVFSRHKRLGIPDASLHDEFDDQLCPGVTLETADRTLRKGMEKILCEHDLIYLDLSHANLPQATILSLSRVLTMKKCGVRSLDLSGNRISPQVACILTGMMTHWRRLNFLRLTNCLFNSPPAFDLHPFSVPFMGSGPHALSSVFQGLIYNDSLTDLEVNNVDIPDFVASVAAESIKFNQSLERVSLQNAGLAEHGISLLFQAGKVVDLTEILAPYAKDIQPTIEVGDLSAVPGTTGWFAPYMGLLDEMLWGEPTVGSLHQIKL